MSLYRKNIPTEPQTITREVGSLDVDSRQPIPLDEFMSRIFSILREVPQGDHRHLMVEFATHDDDWLGSWIKVVRPETVEEFQRRVDEAKANNAEWEAERERRERDALAKLKAKYEP